MSNHLRLRTAPVLLVAALLCIGLSSPAALAGKKKKATVVVVDSSTLSTGKDKHLRVSGHLETARACRGQRPMKLFHTDENGAIISVLGTTTTKANSTWKIQGKLPQASTGNDFFKVKAKKLVTKKFLCRAAVSSVLPVPPPSK